MAFVDLFLEAPQHAPREIILDLDATDDPVHGEQEGRFFNGYYCCCQGYPRAALVRAIDTARQR
jgi:hypothetical protein